MAWRETERSKAAGVRRTYKCNDCFLEWTERHDSADSPVADCPVCALKAEQVRRPVAVTTNKSRAIDYTQRMVEEDYGLTNFADNQRVGDNAIIGPSPMQTAEREAMTRAMVEAGLPAELTQDQQQMAKGFWGSGTPAPTGNPVVDQVLQAAVQSAPAGAAIARSEGVDPVGLIHEASSKGLMNMKLHVAARGEMSTDA